MHITLLLMIVAGAVGGSTRGASLERDFDPIVLDGPTLPALIGSSVGGIVAFRYLDAWEQVPIQVDERKEVDFAVIYNGPDEPPSGLTTIAYADPSTHTSVDPDPAFDENDELVVMARDAGDRAPMNVAGPEGTLIDTGVEIEIIDPLTGALGYVYLFEGDGSIDPDAGQDYITYTFDLLAGEYIPDYNPVEGPNPEDSEAVSAYYRTHFSDRWIRDELNIFAGAATGVDVLDRHTNVFGPGNCFRSEDVFSLHEGAFLTNKDGPVRAIRSYIGASSGPLTQREHIFYERRQDITTFLRVHAIPGIMDLYDYSPDATGMNYYNDLNTSGALVDGFDDLVNVGAIIWEMLTGLQGSLIMTHRTETDVAGFAYTSFYSDTTAPDPPPCTGDAFEYGKSGLWIDETVPNTDPSFGLYNSLVGRRIVYYDTPDRTVMDAMDHAARAWHPLEATTRPYPRYKGDFNGDCRVDVTDYGVFAACLSGPSACAADGCEVFDWDGDCAVTLTDVAGFQESFTGAEYSMPGCYP